jgi:UDP-3-O-[3-hydroxymyristoyl] glucosamine N-acyltransferase
MNLQILAEKIKATIYNPHKKPEPSKLTGLAPLERANKSEVSFFTHLRFMDDLRNTQAAAVIVKSAVEDADVIQLVHPNPQAAMALVGQMFFKWTHSFSGQSPLAYIHPEAKVAESVTLYPYAFIDKGAVIEDNVVIYPYVFIGEDCQIGAGSLLFPGCVIMARTEIGAGAIIHGGAVLGGDGFGFAPARERLEKIPQTGKVVIEKDVEIGSLTSIDRATFDETLIKQGSKLDSHVHVGHNVEVGEESMLCAMVGIAGSTTIGKRFIGAGQAAIGPGLTLGENIVVGGKAGVVNNLSEAGEYHGMPAIPAQEWRRQAILLRRLPEMYKTIQRLEKALEKK